MDKFENRLKRDADDIQATVPPELRERRLGVEPEVYTFKYLVCMHLSTMLILKY